jgi:hypothetical protein
MSARSLLVITSVLMALGPVQALAKGQPTVVHTIDAVPAVVQYALPNAAAAELLSGCGNHRFRDVTTHQCRSF